MRRILPVTLCVLLFFPHQIAGTSENGDSTNSVSPYREVTTAYPAASMPKYLRSASRDTRLDAVEWAIRTKQADVLAEAETDPDAYIRVRANFFRAKWGDVEAAIPLRKDYEQLTRWLFARERPRKTETTLQTDSPLSAIQLLSSCGDGLIKTGDCLGYEMAVSCLLPNGAKSILRDQMLSVLLSAGDARADIQTAACIDPIAFLCVLTETETDSWSFFRIWLRGSFLIDREIPDILQAIASRADPPLENLGDSKEANKILRSLERNNLSTTNFKNALKRLEEKKNSLNQQEPQGLMDISVKRIPLGVVRKGETVKETLSFRIEEGATVELSAPDGTPEMAIALEPVEPDKTQYRVNVTWTPKESGHLANVPIALKATKGDAVDERRILCLGLVARDSAPDWSFERLMTDDTREWWDLDKLK